MQKKGHSSERVRKVIGYIDFLLTTLLFFQVVVFIICPLVKKIEASEVKVPKPKFSDSDDDFEIWPMFIPPIGNQLRDNADKWPYMMLGVFPVLTYVPWLAALSLVESSNPNMRPRLVLSWTQLWMKCNIGTIVFAVVGFFVVLGLHFFGYPVDIPIPILLYLAFRLGVTVEVSKQLEEMKVIVAAIPIDCKEEQELREKAERECEEVIRILINEPIRRDYPKRSTVPVV